MSEGNAGAGAGSGSGAEDDAVVDASLMSRFRRAFERVRAELEALPGDELIPVNLEVQGAVTTVLGLTQKLRGLRPEIVKLVHPSFDLSQYDRIEELALALGHAHSAYLVASDVPRSQDELGKEAIEVRQMLSKDANALVGRKLLDEARLSAIKNRTGPRNVAFDLLAFAALFREHWVAIQGRTAVTLEELQGVELLADQLLSAVGESEQQEKRVGVAADQRKRAFKLFMDAYDDVQRVTYFVRWKQRDADQFAPSLHIAKGRSRKAQPDADAPDSAAAPDVGQGEPDGADATAPLGSGELGTTTQTAIAATSPRAAVKEGLPGGSPFVDEAE